jgi:uncharacterized membrane protein (DUF106 family)
LHLKRHLFWGSFTTSFKSVPSKELVNGESLTGVQLAPILAIFGVAFALSLLSKFLQLVFIDKEKIDSLKKESKEKQDEILRLLKGGESEKKRAEQMQTELMEKNLEAMKGSMVLSYISLPFFLGAFWVLGSLYAGKVFETIIPLPAFNNFNLLNPMSWVPVGLTTTSGYFKMYFFYYLISGALIGLIFLVLEKIIGRKIKFLWVKEKGKNVLDKIFKKKIF